MKYKSYLLLRNKNKNYKGQLKDNQKRWKIFNLIVKLKFILEENNNKIISDRQNPKIHYETSKSQQIEKEINVKNSRMEKEKPWAKSPNNSRDTESIVD